jgi:hypothetical protein
MSSLGLNEGTVTVTVGGPGDPCKLIFGGTLVNRPDPNLCIFKIIVNAPTLIRFEIASGSFDQAPQWSDGTQPPGLEILYPGPGDHFYIYDHRKGLPWPGDWGLTVFASGLSTDPTVINENP